MDAQLDKPADSQDNCKGQCGVVKKTQKLAKFRVQDKVPDGSLNLPNFLSEQCRISRE